MANAIIAWHAAVATDDATKACARMTTAAQQELATAVEDPTCLKPISDIFPSFTATDKAGFEGVKVNADKVTIAGDRAVVPADALSYPAGVTDVLRFHNELDLTKVNGVWQLDSVLEDDLNH